MFPVGLPWMEVTLVEDPMPAFVCTQVEPASVERYAPSVVPAQMFPVGSVVALPTSAGTGRDFQYVTTGAGVEVSGVDCVGPDEFFEQPLTNNTSVTIVTKCILVVVIGDSLPWFVNNDFGFGVTSRCRSKRSPDWVE